MNKVEIREGERIDDLHRNGYLLIQDAKRFCFGIDAVLLSGFAVVKDKECVLDLCTGNGVIPILLAAKTKGKYFAGIEIQSESAEMAQRSVILNELEEKISIFQGDIKHLEKHFKPSSFDVITSNPPYMNEGGGLKNEFGAKAIARHEILCTLEDVVKGAERFLRPGGRFYMVHRPHRLTDILSCLRQHHLEPKRIRFVSAYSHKEPNLVLVEAVRGGKPMVQVMPHLVIYKPDGSYTEEIIEIYYH